MPAKSKPMTTPTTQAGKKTTALFDTVVEQALKQFHNPTWLGEKSPLASPYFLGERLPNVTTTSASDALARGQTLQQLLIEAAEQVAQHQKRWGQLWRDLLQASYFTPDPLPVYQIIHTLHLSEAAYHRHRNAAIQQLGQAIIGLVKPALRLEVGAAPPRLLGRVQTLTELLTALDAGKTVSLSGPGGVGKTTLGQALAHHFAPAATFWYTFAPGLNDRSHSLLFALAWFLQGQGRSTLWSQLVANRGELSAAVALNLLRYDCANLDSRRILLCFDEIDLLRPGESEAHAQLLPLLESLRGLVPLLYIGQKVLVETDLHQALSGLTPPAVAALLQAAGLALAESELAALHRSTQGNPRLLELFSALANSLQRAGESAVAAITNALASFAHEPSLEFLLRRIWRHLNESEMYLLELLAVFRNPMPRTAWNDQAQQAAIDQLCRWQLVQVDERGSLQLLPAFRDAIYQTLLASEERELLHLEAAALRAQYGQFTAAAYHYAAGGEGALAVNLLYTYKEQAIDQGQAEAALTILTQISLRRLEQATQERLTLLRAELQKLLGDYDTAGQTLGSIYWRIPFLAAQRWRIAGDIAELRGEVGQAQQAYQAGLETVEKLISEAAHFHRDLGYLYTNEVDFVHADAEVARMRHEAANLEGFIAEMRGDLPAAESAYLSALQLAQTIQYPYGEANTQNNLGRIYGWRRQLTAAEAQLGAAIIFFRNTGRLNKLASATYNLALARRLAKAYASALGPAEEALGWFAQLGEAYGKAVTFALLAEIHLGLGNLVQAEHYARLVIAAEHTSCLPDGLRTLGEVYTQQGKLAEAEGLLRQSLALAQANQDRILAAYALRALGALQTARADLVAAQHASTQAREIFHELGMQAEID